MLERHNRESVFIGETHNENQQAHFGGNAPSPGVQHLRGNIWNPNAVQADDNEVLIWPAVDAAITISKITINLEAAANEVAGDLKWADAFIGLANATVINDFDTTNGVRVDDSVTAGSVATGKCLYFSFDSSPNLAIKQMGFDIEYTYD